MPLTDALPPLAALRAFDAVARRLSFKSAAEELSVTPTAVSHQIRQLEHFLGLRLIERSPRACRLTAAGTSLFEATNAGFAQIRAVTARLRAGRSVAALTLSATPAFIGLWLVPRLQSLQEQLPGLAIRFHASKDTATFDQDGVDVAIRYGDGIKNPGTAIALRKDEYTPLCSPSLSVRHPSDLSRARLLHVDGIRTPTPAPTWARWCRHAGIKLTRVEAGPRFTDSLQAAQAAIGGQGVILGSPVLLQSALAAGALVRPFKQSLAGATYHFVSGPAGAVQPGVAALRSWFERHLR